MYIAATLAQPSREREGRPLPFVKAGNLRCFDSALHPAEPVVSGCLLSDVGPTMAVHLIGRAVANTWYRIDYS